MMPAAKEEPMSLLWLLAIYAALLLLLGLTVGMAALPLGAFGLVVALTIAAAKAALVVLYFMHLRFASRATWLFAGAGLLWLAILFSMTFSEYLGRTSIPAPNR